MSNAIKKIRNQLGLSRREFAKYFGIKEAAVSHYENLVRHPRIPLAYQIIDFAKSNGINKTLEDIYPRDDFTRD